MATKTNLVMPTRGNAERLLDVYNQAYCDDEDLWARVCDPAEGIDGLTEPQTRDGILSTMERGETFTLEHIDAQGECNGFIIVRCATPKSFATFRHDLFLHTLGPHELRFNSDRHQAELNELLENSALTYIAELVSLGGATTPSLVSAAYQHLANEVLQTPDFVVLAKCLIGVQIEGHVNPLGNRPARQFIASVGLGQVARATQTRRLRLTRRHTPQSPTGPPVRSELIAHLEFGVFAGWSAGARRMLEMRRPTLPR